MDKLKEEMIAGEQEKEAMEQKKQEPTKAEATASVKKPIVKEDENGVDDDEEEENRDALVDQNNVAAVDTQGMKSKNYHLFSYCL